MIDRFFYPHDCIVSRGTNKSDENGNEINDIVYYGECGVQVGVNGDVSLQGDIYQRSPCLIIPVTNVIFMIGDKVEATIENGQKIDYTVRSPRITNEQGFDEDDGINGTTLWLKKGKDV